MLVQGNERLQSTIRVSSYARHFRHGRPRSDRVAMIRRAGVGRPGRGRGQRVDSARVPVRRALVRLGRLPHRHRVRAASRRVRFPRRLHHPRHCDRRPGGSGGRGRPGHRRTHQPASATGDPAALNGAFSGRPDAGGSRHRAGEGLSHLIRRLRNFNADSAADRQRSPVPRDAVRPGRCDAGRSGWRRSD
jgi:hypothetical protein